MTAARTLDYDSDDTDDGDDVLLDGHGNRTYAVRPEVVELHRAVVAAGWEHKNHPTSPYENLVALLATVDDLDRDPSRSTVVAFAFKYICGYGRETTPRALDAVDDDPDVDAVVPGGDRR
jgi:hypothetical protein